MQINRGAAVSAAAICWLCVMSNQTHALFDADKFRDKFKHSLGKAADRFEKLQKDSFPDGRTSVPKEEKELQQSPIDLCRENPNLPQCEIFRRQPQ